MADNDQESYFQAIPWCTKLLNDPNFYIIKAPSRQYKESTEDSLVAETLKTDNTVRSCLLLCKHPTKILREGGSGSGGLVQQIDEVRTLMSIGSGLNGHSHILHGGMLAGLFDEVMGMLLTVNKDLQDPAGRDETFTAYLHVNFLKPVATPQTVLFTAKFREVKGRKCYIDSTVEDGHGVVMAKGEALWITIRQPEGKL